MTDQLYDTLYSGKEEPGVCGLFVIGNEERTNCKSLHERKSFSWRVCAIHGIRFRKLVTAGVLPYIPLDAVKLAIALLVGRQIRARILKAGLL